MKKIILGILLFARFIQDPVFAQEKSLRFTGLPIQISSEQQQTLSSLFKQYLIVELPIEQIYDYVKSNPSSSNFILQLGNKYEKNIHLTQNELRSADYYAEETGVNGTIKIPRTECINYAGYLNGSEVYNFVRLNISKEEINGVILESGEAEICVEPLSKFTPKANKNYCIVYTRMDLVPRTMASCSGGKTIIEEIDERSPKKQKASIYRKSIAENEHVMINDDSAPPPAAPPPSFALSDCYKLEIATEIDWEGSDKNYDNNDVLNNLNIVEPYYINPFNIRFQVRYQHQWTTNSDPYNEPDLCAGIDRLDEFKSYWSTNYTHVARDITLMYSGVDFSGGTIGCAFTGTINDLPSFVSAYACIQVVDPTFTSFLSTAQFQRAIMAHEIGHIFNASHDACSGLGNGPIMCSDADASCTTLLCTPHWSAASIASIEAILLSNSTVYNLKERRIREDMFLFNIPLPLTFSGNIVILNSIINIFNTSLTIKATDYIDIKPGYQINNMINNGNMEFKIAPCDPGGL